MTEAATRSASVILRRDFESGFGGSFLSLCPTALHGFGDTLSTFGCKLSLSLRHLGGSGGNGIFAAFWTAWSSALDSVYIREQMSCLLQLRDLSIDLCNDASYFHAQPPSLNPAVLIRTML